MSGMNLATGEPIPVHLFASLFYPERVTAEIVNANEGATAIGSFRPLRHCEIIQNIPKLTAFDGEIILEQWGDTDPLPRYDTNQRSCREPQPTDLIVRGVFSQSCLHCAGCQLFQNYLDNVGLEEIKFQQTLT